MGSTQLLFARLTVLVCFAVFARFIAAAEPNADEEHISAKNLEFFESKIRPVLVGHCYECHSVKHGIVEANYNMDTRDGMLAGGDRGIAIIAGNAEASLLFKAIRYTHDDLEMPPSGRLNADTLRAIEGWINGGAVMPEGNETVVVADKLDIETAQKGHKVPKAK